MSKLTNSALSLAAVLASERAGELTDKLAANSRFASLKVGDVIRSYRRPSWSHTVTEVGEHSFKTVHSGGTEHHYKKDILVLWGSSVYIEKSPKARKARMPLEVEA